MPPLLFSGLRSLLGGIILTAFLIPKWDRLKWRQNWVIYTVSALINTVLYYGVQGIGLNLLPGGLFSVLVYFQPILVGVFAWLWLGEKMTVFKVVGLLIGFGGIVILSADGFTGAISMFGVILGLLSAASWAFGVIVVKKTSHKVDAMWIVALPSIIGGVILTGAGSIVESWTSIEWNGYSLFGLGYGATLGIPLAFVIYYALVNNGEASKVASFTFLVPLTAVLIGTLWMDEPFTYNLLTGLVLIIVSIYLVNSKRKVNPEVQTGQ